MTTASAVSSRNLTRLVKVLALLVALFAGLFGLQSWRSEKAEQITQITQMRTALALGHNAVDQYWAAPGPSNAAASRPRPAFRPR